MEFLEKETLLFSEKLEQKNISDTNLPIQYAFYHVEYYDGLSTHKKAAEKAIRDFQSLKNKQNSFFDIPNNTVYVASDDSKFYTVTTEKMRGELVEVKEFFSTHIDKQKSFYYAFTSPPHPTSNGLKEFQLFNQLLFPIVDDLIVYSWNDSWSNYFITDSWYGNFFWTIYDPMSYKMTVLGASETD